MQVLEHVDFSRAREIRVLEHPEFSSVSQIQVLEHPDVYCFRVTGCNDGAKEVRS